MYHSLTYRVPYADTDQMGVVYHANYLVYFERSRTEMLRTAGLTYRELEQGGLFLAVTRAVCNYRRSAGYDDLLEIRSRVSEIRRASLSISSEVYRDAELLVDGCITLAAIDRQHKPLRLPEFFLTAIRPGLDSALVRSST
ncbi:MAG: acyl-CoA thioesterase [Oligosphaeraceae bacterium]|nr:acyl-CoA thioesterase [Oligosphaeraceae bacterium]